MKKCTVCDEVKEYSEFAIIRPKKSGGFTYASKCRKCHYEAYKDYYLQYQKDKFARKPKRTTLTVEERKERARLARKRWVERDKLKNPDKWKEKYAESHQRHKAYYKQKYRERQLRKRDAEGFHTDKQWEALKAKYNNTCLCCGATDEQLTRDHVVPLIHGGTDNIDNIQPLCHGCNSKKNATTVDYR